jgi:hypothetical protein
MSESLYPQLKAVLGDNYADLAALPPQTDLLKDVTISAEADLFDCIRQLAEAKSDCMRQLAEADEAIDVRERWLNQAEYDLAEAEALIDDLRYEIDTLEAQSIPDGENALLADILNEENALLADIIKGQQERIEELKWIASAGS